jgi:hypothetical protein
MNEEEARERCRELAETSPDRETHSWLPRQEADGQWAVVRLAIPPARPVEAKASKPTEPQTARDDPRIAFEQNIPNHGVG